MTNRSARALSGGRTGHIGLTIPMMRGDYFADDPRGGARGSLRGGHAARPLHDAARARPRGLRARAPQRRRDRRRDHPAPAGVERRARGPSGESGFPFVVVDPRIPLDDGIPAVSAAHRAGAHWRRPSTSSRSGIAASATSAARAGWAATTSGSRATTARSQRPASVPIVRARSSRATSRRPAVSPPANVLLDLPDPPTAIFAANDNMAAGVLQAAHERGLTVPGDLSVVGLRRRRPGNDREPGADDGSTAPRRARPNRCELADAHARKSSASRPFAWSSRRGSSSVSRPGRHRSGSG